jgi:hypothetical protein
VQQCSYHPAFCWVREELASTERKLGLPCVEVGKSKTFVFLAADESTFSLSAKLPSFRDVALQLPFASPTEYGLGRSGWVTARFPRNAKLPVGILKLWIEESYHAVAPKRLSAQLGNTLPPVRRQRGGTTKIRADNR